MPGLSTSEACANVRTTRQETRIGSGWLDRVWDWKLEDKTNPRSGEDLLVAAVAEDYFFFREDITARARLSAL